MYIVTWRDDRGQNSEDYKTKTAAEAAKRIYTRAGSKKTQVKVMKKNPAPARARFEVITSDGKGKPWKVVAESDTASEARDLLDYYRKKYTGTFMVRDASKVSAKDTYKRNPRGRGGIGYYVFRHPETGEEIMDTDPEKLRRIATKIANRTGSAITVKPHRAW